MRVLLCALHVWAVLAASHASPPALSSHPHFTRVPHHHQQQALRLAQSLRQLSDEQLDQAQLPPEDFLPPRTTPPHARADREATLPQALKGNSSARAMPALMLRVPDDFWRNLSTPSFVRGLREALDELPHPRLVHGRVFADGRRERREETDEEYAQRVEHVEWDMLRNTVFDLERERRRGPAVQRDEAVHRVLGAECLRFTRCSDCVKSGCAWAVRKSPIFPGRVGACKAAGFVGSPATMWATVSKNTKECPVWPTRLIKDVVGGPGTAGYAVKMAVRTKLGWASCSGWMCGRRQLCTAAHCMLVSGSGELAEEVYAIPSAEDTSASFFVNDETGAFGAPEWSPPFQQWDRPYGYSKWTGKYSMYKSFESEYPRYSVNKSATPADTLRVMSHDFAVLELDWNIGELAGFNVATRSVPDGLTATISGYPVEVEMSANGLDVVAQYVLTGAQYNVEGRVVAVIKSSTTDIGLLRWNAVTAGGHSGGPTVVNSWFYRHIIGTHSSSNRLTVSLDSMYSTAGASMVKRAWEAWGDAPTAVDMIEYTSLGRKPKTYAPLGGTVRPGGAITGSLWLRNMGFVATPDGSVTATLVLSADQIISKDDQRVCSYTLPRGFRSQQQQAVTVACTLPYDTSKLKGSWFVGVRWDVAGDAHPADNVALLSDRKVLVV